MTKGLKIDYETADRIALCVMKDQLTYLRNEQRWFESSEEERIQLQKELGYSQWVHPEDYAMNASKYIPALELMIAYFGGYDEV